PQIANNSTNTLTIDMRVGSGNNFGLDIDANTGDIIYNGTNNGSGSMFFDGGPSQLRFDGNGGRTVTINNRIIDGNNTASGAIRSNTIVVYTVANNSYSAGTFLDAGQLWLASAANVAGPISVGTTTAGRTDNSSVFASGTTGGQTVTNAITIRSGGTGTITL